MELPRESLRYQRDQVRFWEDRRRRYCKKCVKEYIAQPPDPACPACKETGDRIFDRMTIMAGRRFGKSLAGSVAGTEEACFPGTLGWACAPTFPKLETYVIPAFQKLIPSEWVENYDGELKRLTLKNKSQIQFQSLEGDPDRGRGQGLDWLWIDEVCELTKQHWDVIRPSLAGNTVAFFTTTPRGYDWVYEDLFKPAVIEPKIPGYWACHSKTSESANPRITSEFLTREKLQMSDEMYRQEYEADFVSFHGAIYGTTVRPQVIHTDEDMKKLIPEWPKIDPSRTLYIGIDTGADHPFGLVKIVNTGENMIVVEDYLRRDGVFVDHAEVMKTMAGNHKIVRFAINKNERQPMLEFGRMGINCVPAENDQHGGIERVKRWLKNGNLWFFKPRCQKTLEQMMSLRVVDDKTDGQNRGKLVVYKKNDELPDCVRYAMAVAPEPQAPIIIKPKYRDISMYTESQQRDILLMRKYDERMENAEKRTTVASDAGEFWT